MLQVGHIERFNPVLAALEGKLNNPRFLEVTRLSPYPNRSTDIGVVLDLMIHDIEIILHIVRSPIVSMDPVGIAVLSKGEDIANVRFRFESGCVANVTASRISRDKVRKIRVFQENAYLSLDYQKQDGVMYRLHDGPKGKEIIRDKVEIRRGEPLKIELEAFIHCAREGAQSPRYPVTRPQMPSISRWKSHAASRKPIHEGRSIFSFHDHPVVRRRRGQWGRPRRRSDERLAHARSLNSAFSAREGRKCSALAAEPFDDWIAEAGVLGLWDVLKHYGYFRKKFHRMLDQIDEDKAGRRRSGRLSRIQSPAGESPAGARLFREDSLLYQPSSLGMEPRTDPENGALSRLDDLRFSVRAADVRGERTAHGLCRSPASGSARREKTEGPRDEPSPRALSRAAANGR